MVGGVNHLKVHVISTHQLCDVESSLF